MIPFTISKDDIRTAAALLRAGETVVFPTETTYRLGADASNALAVRRIFQIKGRPVDHSLIVHIADAAQLDLWAKNIPDTAWRLAAQFWPGPLTLVLPRRSDVMQQITGGQDTISVRVPDHPVAAALLRAFGGGIATRVANRFGRVGPATAHQVCDERGSQVSMILDSGPCRVGVESTIISLRHGAAVLLRSGALSVEAIEGTLNQKILLAPPTVRKVYASGMPGSHYVPATSLEIHPANALWPWALQLAWQGYKVAVLKLGDDGECFESRGITSFYMPASADEYGRVLFAMLHRLDHAGFDRLLAEAPPTTQEWLAINDRMLRAAQVRYRETWRRY